MASSSRRPARKVPHRDWSAATEKRSWLEGPEIAGAGGTYPGEGLGLPESGPGSVAGLGRRFLSILLDFVVCALVATGLRPVWHAQLAGAAVYGVYTLLLTGTTGQTIGMRLLGLRLLGGGGRPPGPLWAFVRVGLTALLFPPFFVDEDRRGLHDRTAGTVVVLSR